MLIVFYATFVQTPDHINKIQGFFTDAVRQFCKSHSVVLILEIRSTLC